MKVIIFGATGMVGQGVLRECLLDPAVEFVQTVGRTVSDIQHPKLREIVHTDMWHYTGIMTCLSGFDACFFCLGVSSLGMSEADYEHVTYGITMAVAEALVSVSPNMTFIYVSGAGTDGSEKGRSMWARVKGKTENALMRLPFKAVYAFRPGVIEALHGIRSKTPMYRRVYPVMKPLLPLLRRTFPNYILTTAQIGRAMIALAKNGAERRILESSDIRRAS